MRSRSGFTALDYALPERLSLVVATYCDEHRPELDYPHLQQHFPEMLVGRYEIDNRSGSGIPDLRSALAMQASHLPQIGQWISKRWIAVRDDLLARGRPNHT